MDDHSKPQPVMLEDDTPQAAREVRIISTIAARLGLVLIVLGVIAVALTLCRLPFLMLISCILKACD
jgi:hypothetical protein